jgi:adenylate kinase family enzyme
MSTFPCSRIVVVGTTSSGKSTLAKQLADKLGADFIELDALHWEPNWMEAPLEVFRQRVETATRSQAWVVAGNYHVVRDIVWPRAQAVIWLDYPFHIVFWRLFTRTIRRTIFREVLWNGNRESFWTHLKLWSEESLFHWLFKTYWRRKRETPGLLTMPEHAHLKLIHFRHPRQAQVWLEDIIVCQTMQPIA